MLDYKDYGEDGLEDKLPQKMGRLILSMVL
ncbi:MAG: hypothetical protein Ta2E_13400 [Mycoplasmoidaceae bacterium]|nr:MAG: hypothetical protein Ta2E_13400 [Mycoplasmoidaceae bacterium]